MKYSDEYIELFKERLGMKKTTVYSYPFISGRGFKDVREVFVQTPEEDQELITYYLPFLAKVKRKWDTVKAIQQAVNQRLRYRTDISTGYTEYWSKPIDTHRNRGDDCDGYACLICYLLRLFGFHEYEVFVRVGNVNRVDGTKGEYHAYCIVVDTESKGKDGRYTPWKFVPIEGSWYPELSQKENKATNRIDIDDNPRYEQGDWMTNDKISMSRNMIPFKMVR